LFILRQKNPRNLHVKILASNLCTCFWERHKTSETGKQQPGRVFAYSSICLFICLNLSLSLSAVDLENKEEENKKGSSFY